MLRNHLVVVAMIGVGLYTILSSLAPLMAGRTRVPVRVSGRDVRPSGPREMRDRPRSWDMTDERSDESFPASDPPGTY